MDQPSIAFVVAALNEEATIERCLRSLLEQDYPAERIEVAVVDGGSSDRTRELVARLAAEHPRVQLLDNPARTAPHAFNIGVARTTGELVSLQSAHAVVGKDYAAVLATAFRTSGASLVGGRGQAQTEPSLAPPDAQPDGSLGGSPGALPDALPGGSAGVLPGGSAGVLPGGSPMAEAIVLATSSPLGPGPARHRYSDRAGWVDTAYPGAYRRELFAEIGGFDETLARNQDDELHLRARLAGHRMWFEPRLRSTYLPRRTLPALWRQYRDYGWWRAVTLAKHRRVAAWRHLVPAVLVAGLAGGPVLALCWRRRRGVLGGFWAGGAGAWLAVLLASARYRAPAGSGKVRRRVPLAVGCLHLAYGVGFWHGVLALVRRGHGRRAR